MIPGGKDPKQLGDKMLFFLVVMIFLATFAIVLAPAIWLYRWALGML